MKKTHLLIAACIPFLLMGCGKKETEVVNYDLVAYQEDQLQDNTYYIKTDTGFYPVAMGTQAYGGFDENSPSFTGAGDTSPIATAVSNDRMVWYGPDDAQIPTMYKNQSLVFVTSGQIPASWTFERYEDAGYTLGIRALAENSGGRYETVISPLSLHPLSSAYTTLGEQNTGTIIGIDQIGSTKITRDYVSRGGTITGLSKDQVYNVDLYRGTSYLQAQLAADTHAFVSYELFTTAEYSYNQTFYVTITVPDYFLSGYYYINGMGMFKYVANDSAQGISGIDFNTPYYVGTDDAGNLLTREQYEAYLNGTYEAETEEQTKSAESNVWRFTQLIDNTMNEISFRISYSDMYIAPEMEVSSAQLEQAEAQKQSSSSGSSEDPEIPPKAILRSPSGEEHEFQSDSTDGTALTCTIQMPESGEWVVEITGMEKRIFDISSSIDSGHSNSLVHEGSGTAEMNYYLANALMDGKLDVTWDNQDHAAVIEISGPDGTKYTTNTEHIGDDDVQMGIVLSDYGHLTLNMGTLIAGNYTIRVTGENLGRVRFETSEMTSDDKKALRSGDDGEDEEDTDTTDDDSEEEGESEEEAEEEEAKG